MRHPPPKSAAPLVRLGAAREADRARLETSIFAFATDLADEGVEHVLDNVQFRAELGGVSIAASYHEGRDIFPHNPRHKIRFLEEGALFFPPDPARWQRVRLRPTVSKMAHVLPDAVTAANRRGMVIHAWTVFLHNGALATAHPDCAPENAFGDRYVTDLCPAHPDVRAFACVLASEVARLGVASICAESLHYHLLEHGYAHERYFLPLDPRARYLLGLCFCRDCLRVARDHGVDGEGLRRIVRLELERVFSEGAEEFAGELDRTMLASLAGGELLGYVQARQGSVASLVAEVAEAARAQGAKLEFIDPAGALKASTTGRSASSPAPPISWQLGVDVAAVAGACDGITVTGYVRDPDLLRTDLLAYGDSAVSVIIRPMPPDCASADNLHAKVELAGSLGLSRVDFYHYGFMRLAALDWIRAAVAI